MATKKLQILTELGPSEEKIKSAVDDFFVTSPMVKSLLDKFCPPFEVSGSAVTCNPVEGYPLEVVSHIDGNPNLIQYDPSQEFWTNYDMSVQGFELLHDIPDLPSGEYVLRINAMYDPGLIVYNYDADTDSWVVKVNFNEDGIFEAHFTHNGGILRLENNSWGVEAFSLTLVAGTEYTGEPKKFTSVKLTHSNGTETREYTAEFGQTVSGGSFNWSTGALSTSNPNLLSDDIYNSSSWGTVTDIYTVYPGTYRLGTFKPGVYTLHVGTPDRWFALMAWDNETGGYEVMVGCQESGLDLLGYEGESWMTFSIDQETELVLWCADDSVYDALLATCEFKLEAGDMFTGLEYDIIQLPVQPIPALPGVNTLTSDTGDTTVTGGTDPNHVIDTLTDRIAALEAAAVDNT